ncbi:MAG: hypothetical protein ACRDIY_19605 [Chloroflexota bacterium]
MGTCLLAPPCSPKSAPPTTGQVIGQGTVRDVSEGAGRRDDGAPVAPTRTRAWRDRVTTGWLDAADRLADLKPRWRGMYEAVVAAVGARLRRYPSVDLLMTAYFQSTDFAAEEIQARYPNVPHPWDVRLIEDVAWGRRLREIQESAALAAIPEMTARSSPAAEHAELGARCAADDDWPGARRAFQAAVATAPTVGSYWQQLGIACGRLGDWRWAQDALERASRLAPTGELATLLSEVRTMRRVVRQLRDRPFDATLHTRIGTLLMAWEHGDLALDHLKRAIELAPSWATPRIHLGLEYHYRQEWDAAEVCYQAARELGSDEASLNLLIEACEAHDLPTERPLDVVS